MKMQSEYNVLKQLATAEKQRFDKNHQEAVEEMKKIDEILSKENLNLRT